MAGRRARRLPTRASGNALAACGGGDDLQDRLDLADPAVRFVHASAIAPNLTLYRADVAQSDATDVPYKFASNYFDVAMGVADWSVKTATGALTLGSVSIDPVRGDKYTIVALPGSSSDSSVALIVDPYNKPLTSESTRIRVMNASFNAASVDLYLNAPGTSINAGNPLIAATAYKTAGPASGSDSMDVPGGSYQLTITAAGTKTVLFSGPLPSATTRTCSCSPCRAPCCPAASRCWRRSKACRERPSCRRADGESGGSRRRVTGAKLNPARRPESTRRG
jgi:hypothetical protein